MNPASSAHHPRQLMQDVKRPEVKVSRQVIDNALLKTQVVDNIPIQSPTGQVPKPQAAAKEDEELDKIIQDVSIDLKSDDHKSVKNNLLDKFPAKPKSTNPFPAMTAFITLTVTSLLVVAAIFAYK